MRIGTPTPRSEDPRRQDAKGRGQMTFYCAHCDSVAGYGYALPAHRTCRVCGGVTEYPKEAENG